MKNAASSKSKAKFRFESVNIDSLFGVPTRCASRYVLNDW